MAGWMDQWDLIRRRLDAVRVIYAGHGGGTEEARDAVYGLFEAIHHLKDWVGNDPACALSKRDGDNLINSTFDLQLCADVANGSKHLVLTRSRTGDLSTSLPRIDVTVNLDIGLVQHFFAIESGGQEYDALRTAEAGVAAWDARLRLAGLL